jgi:hypothetical protein
LLPYFDLPSEAPLRVRRSAAPKFSANFGAKTEKPANDAKIEPKLDGTQATGNFHNRIKEALGKTPREPGKPLQQNGLIS